ncbi:long-chain-fatty-acid--CoA ligase [Xanthobacter oligotrophicus]|uniref:Long-chain-fatty-acid--CoA ligase n=1 Tax=Xanthobacter oligotrophicus TaxID=2607286 RepID=A0ABW6ZZS2_9HYPH
MLNLSTFIAYHAARTPDRTALIYEDRPISYADFSGRIGGLAAVLAARGIGPGDVVAVFMRNSPAFLEIAFAASHLGAVFLPINFRLAPAEVAYILEDAGAKVLFVDDEFAAVCELVTLKIVLDAAAQADSRVLHHAVAAPPPQCPRVSGDLVRLMYTSGTTARPKGVMHSYENIYWKSIDHIIALGLTADDRLLVVGPLYHVGAFDFPGIAVLWLGGTFCVLRDFDAEATLAAIACHRLTGAWLAPVMLSRILAVEDTGRFDLTSLRWCVGGGERTPESRIRDFKRVFTAGRYIDAYGLTETCSGDTLMEAGRELEKIGSTGRALAHVEIRIADPAGNALPPDTRGEICVRGPKVTKGYWNDPQKTADSFHGDWLRTGDIGHLDEEGFLYLTDRAKDMIISGAENVASSEVEDVLYKLPEVAEVAIIGLPDAQWGERVVAVVVPHAGQTVTFEQVQRHCRAHLAGFKVPKELKLREAMPRNPSGKVLKRVLRTEYGDA